MTFIITNISKKVLILLSIALAFIIISIWRVLSFGFYSDDWIFLSKTIYLPATLQVYLGVNGYSRPVYAVIAWALNRLANGSPVVWQVISSCIVLANISIACGIIRHVAICLGYDRRASLIGGVYGAAVLFLSPWMLAVFAWPTGVLTLWSFILFGAGFLIIETHKNLLSKCFGLILALCGFLSYEAYWFTFLPLLLIVKNRSLMNIRAALSSALWYVIPLTLAVSYQRILVPLIVPGRSKPISVNFSLIINNIIHLERFISAAIFPLPSASLLIAVLTVAFALLFKKAISAEKLLYIIAALSLGYIITAAIHGAAGYGLAGTGVMSRSMAAPGFYFSILLGILVAASGKMFRKQGGLHQRQYALTMLFGIILALLLAAFSVRTAEWAYNKQLSTKVLATLATTVDRNYLRDSAKDISVIVQIEGDANGELFGAYWELGGAIALTDPTLVPDQSIWFLPARQGAWGTIWDGENVIQTVCQTMPRSEASRRPSRISPLYYRIDPKTGGVLESGRLARGKAFGCNDEKPTLDY